MFNGWMIMYCIQVRSHDDWKQCVTMDIVSSARSSPPISPRVSAETVTCYGYYLTAGPARIIAARNNGFVNRAFGLGV